MRRSSRTSPRASIDRLEARRLLAADPVITEFLAQNAANRADEDGAFSDWIEIHNPDNAATLDLSGYYLTDDAAQPARWQFPQGTTLGAGRYLLVWASGKDRRTAGAPLHANFSLETSGEYLGLRKPDGATVVSQVAPAFPAQREDVSFGVVGSTFTNPTYAHFASPTPLAANTTAAQVSEPAFSRPRGHYEDDFSLTLTSGTAGATIRYTTDGSAPTSSSTAYSGPISVTTTKIVRAAAFKSGLTASAPVAHSYIFLDDVIRQPRQVSGFPTPRKPLSGGGSTTTVVEDTEMDPDVVNNSRYSGVIKGGLMSIPTLSITAKMSDIFGSNGFNDTSDIERPVSIELIDPAHPEDNTAVTGAAEGHSHNRVKRSYRLSFSAATGPTKWKTDLLKNAALNGDSASDELDSIVLRAGNNRSWARANVPAAYTEDEWYRSSQVAMSGHGSHGAFVHLYLNGAYWGLYNPAELPNEKWQGEYFPGDEDDYFSINHADRRRGSSTRWDYLMNTVVNRNQSSSINYNEFRQYVDVPQFSDYLILNWYQATTDWPDNNWYAGNRNTPTPAGARFFGWDGEKGWDRGDYSPEVTSAFVHPAFRRNSTDNNEMPRIWRAGRANSDFLMTFADRVYKHTANGGALTDEKAIGRWDVLNDHVEDAIVGESARWGDMGEVTGDPTRTRANDWEPYVTKVRGYMQGNAARLISALRAEGYYPSINPPRFNQRGGPVDAGFDVTLSNPNSGGTIYYTTDGSDPRASGGGRSSRAVAYTGPIDVAVTTRLRVRVQNGTTWSAEDDVTFSVSPLTKLRVTELMHNPAPPQPAGSGDGDEFEFIELRNTGSTPLNLNGVRLDGAVEFTFGNVTLGAGQYAVLVENPAAFVSRYGTLVPIAGQYNGKFGDEGETVRLIDAAGNAILDFGYSPTWYPTQVEGQGRSLVVIDPLAAPVTWNNKSAWKVSDVVHGTPGTSENRAPTVDATGPGSVTLPAGATVNAAVADDGVPLGSSVTINWSKVSGPGTVTFANPGAASTTATFSAAGAYVLRATASDGQLSASDDLSITVNLEPPVVTGFTLIDAVTDKDLMPLREGDTINLAALANRELNVRADGTGTIGSIRFGFDPTPGTFVASFRVESAAPRALFGDDPGPDYRPGTLAVGGHTLTATPFTAADATGTAGAALTVRFTVVDEPVAPATVEGRHVFYNRSAFDGNDPLPTAADDAAVDAGKSALLPGQTATAANVTAYSRGINGVMVDVTGLPPGAVTGGLLGPEDVAVRTTTPTAPNVWSAGPAPSSVTVRPGAGVGGSDRVTLIWPDGAITNRWAEVTLLANADTRLAAPDVFSLGNLIGDTDGSGSVNLADFGALRQDFGRTDRTIADGRGDFNRDRAVNLADFGLLRANFGKSLPAPPASASFTAGLLAVTADEDKDE